MEMRPLRTLQQTLDDIEEEAPDDLRNIVIALRKIHEGLARLIEEMADLSQKMMLSRDSQKQLDDTSD